MGPCKGRQEDSTRSLRRKEGGRRTTFIEISVKEGRRQEESTRSSRRKEGDRRTLLGRCEGRRQADSTGSL